MRKLLLLILISTVLLFGCTQPGPTPTITPSATPVLLPTITPQPTVFQKADDSMSTEQSVSKLVNGNTQFALDLYARYSPQGNVFFSPYSISTALVMTYEGARGQTATEMENVLHLSNDPGVRQPAFASLYNTINAPGKNYSLNTANALWFEKTYKFQPAYLDLVQKYYGGNAQGMDFIGQPEPSRITINKWVEAQTANRIKDLIPAGVIDSGTRLVLTNAIYFKGKWETPFKKENTEKADFAAPSGNVMVDMMYVYPDNAKYLQFENLQVLELPYADKDLSMIIFLPEKGSNLDVTTANLKKWTTFAGISDVQVYLPKFKLETEYQMADDLIKMGMPTAFSGNADFSGIADGLAISQVIHKAFVEVNEEGTEAAAATAVIMKATAVFNPEPPKVFRADHPFTFLIKDNKTGSILFMGKLSDPTQ